MTAQTSPPHGLARSTLAYVLAGRRGSRLKHLTDKRAKPAVFFGGNTRIIDFALSNALNSGIRHIAVATQPGLVVGEDAGLDAQRFHRTPAGVTLATQAMLESLES